jgi:hypothetical protein
VKNGIFTRNNIWTGTMLGGPLAGGYFLYRNFKIFNQPLNAKLSLIFSILFTVLLLSLVNNIPENIPHILIPFIYTGIIYIITIKSQGKNIDEYIEQRKELSGWIKTIIISVICFLITLSLYFIPMIPGYYKYYVAQNTIQNIGNIPKLDATTVSKEYGIQTIYYNGGLLDEKDIDKTADFLYDFGIFNDKIIVFVYINNENGIYTLYLNSTLLRLDVMDFYKKLVEEFPDKKIKVKFFDKQINNVGAEIYNENY